MKPSDVVDQLLLKNNPPTMINITLPALYFHHHHHILFNHASEMMTSVLKRSYLFTIDHLAIKVYLFAKTFLNVWCMIFISFLLECDSTVLRERRTSRDVVTWCLWKRWLTCKFEEKLLYFPLHSIFIKSLFVICGDFNLSQSRDCCHIAIFMLDCALAKGF